MENDKIIEMLELMHEMTIALSKKGTYEDIVKHVKERIPEITHPFIGLFADLLIPMNEENKKDRERLQEYLQDFKRKVREETMEIIRGTSPARPLTCFIPYGGWNATGLGSLDLPAVEVIFYDKDKDAIMLSDDECDGALYRMDDMCIEEQLELLGGLKAMVSE